MASPSRRRAENVEGDLFVDDTCIDCDTCRWMAPEVYAAVGGQSAVVAQPDSDAAWTRALQALISCPTASIGVAAGHQDAMQAAQAGLPDPIADGVYHCGYHAKSSFGAASYLIRRPDGNVLVDSPRYAAPLAKRLEEMGGVRYLYLTHRDDVADHKRWAEHFGCQRILHADDVTADTRGVEVQPEGLEPTQLANDLLVIPVPGHTKGHTVLLHGRFLFTGDHLAWSDRRRTLIAFRRACWYSWPEQQKSMQRLLAHDFEWVLPGHGRRHHDTVDGIRRHLTACIDWMATVG